jgi:hypothetical protein
MARIITKEHAIKIRKKLKCKNMGRDNAHDNYGAFVDGILIGIFGIRRGSEKDLGHGHIPDVLHLSPHDTRELAQCNISRAEWETRMRQGGFATPANP